MLELSEDELFLSSPHTLRLIGLKNVSRAFECQLEPIFQRVPIERLGKIGHGPSLHHLIADASERKRRDKNYRHFRTYSQEMFLELWAAHPAHSHVSDKTFRLLQRLGAQKCFTRLKGLDVISERFHQATCCQANIIVVVYN
jgi:hypothetical protein